MPQSWGGGLSWTWHFTPWLGLTTGAELAIYKQTFSAADAHSLDPGMGNYVFSGQILDGPANDYTGPGGDPNKNFYYAAFALPDFKETDMIYALQVPLMLQLMAPLGPNNRIHFVLGAGAKLGINLASSFHQTFRNQEVYMTRFDAACQRELLCAQNKDDGKSVFDYVGGSLSLQNDLDYREKAYYPDPTGGSQPGAEQEKKAYLREDGDFVSNPDQEKKGIASLAKINVIGAAEAGFRWALAPGLGLYTGVYFDYGFMPLTTAGDSNVGIVGFDNNYSIISANSILDASGYPSVKVENSDQQAPKYSFNKSSDKLVNKVTSLGAGVKVRLAFGKVAAKKPVEPTIVYVDRVVRDTVVKTNTVTVRDTVVKTNTIIEKEIIRDTITIIKEIPVEIQKTMADLSNTMFDFNKSVIKEAAKGPLNSVVKWLQENPEVKVEISGHTDSVGSAAYNQKLSEARAKAVYDYFISQGVSKWRLAYAGYGKEKPIATNETEEGRAQNRRVELQIIE